MGRLVYTFIGSLDGFIADADGSYAFAFPGDDVVEFLNDQLEGIRTYLHGRRMYEEMTVWETDPELADSDPQSRRFADLWTSADKVVYSTTLTSAPTRRTRLVSRFDSDEVRALKESAPADLSIDGPTIAAHALRAGLVDEIHRFTVPAVVGGGTPVFPAGLRLDLDLVETQTFERGITYARYVVR